MMYGGLVVTAIAVAFSSGLILLRLPGPMAVPAPDRWHKKSTPATGGSIVTCGMVPRARGETLARPAFGDH
jgi:hypothetical protein